MSYLILFDDFRSSLLPLTYTRPVSEIRVGITTLREKWEYMLQNHAFHDTEQYLQLKYPHCPVEEALWVNGSIIPNPALVEEIKMLKDNEELCNGTTVVAFRGTKNAAQNKKNCTSPYDQIKNVYDIFCLNDKVLRSDYAQLTAGRQSGAIDKTNLIIGNPSEIFIEEGACVEGAILNCKEGPVYIGQEATVMEGAILRGPVALCEHATAKMGAKIYDATTIGPYCKVGGEVCNVVFFGYSNKGHDGFVGNSVIGEWCNLGAGTNSSNLKNNYGTVKLWNYALNDFADTGLQFCGLIMGDHSKCGIATMFNTGTVVGVCCNLFGSGYHTTHVPSFTFGSPPDQYTPLIFDKATEIAQRVFIRRHRTFNDTEATILKDIFNKVAL